MSFNKRILSEKSIRIRANADDYEDFFNYLSKADVFIIEDKFSEEVWFKMKNCSLKNHKDTIIEIMNECKG